MEAIKNEIFWKQLKEFIPSYEKDVINIISQLETAYASPKEAKTYIILVLAWFANTKEYKWANDAWDYLETFTND